MIVLCARCGASLSAPSDACPTCDRPSALARFAVALAAHVRAGRSLDEAAREAAPIAASKVEA